MADRARTVKNGDLTPNPTPSGVPKHLNPGRGRPMRGDNPTAQVLIARGMSIAELGRRVNISRVKLSEYMRGVLPWPRTALRRIAIELDVPIGVLTGEIALGGEGDAARQQHPSGGKS